MLLSDYWKPKGFLLYLWVSSCFPFSLGCFLIYLRCTFSYYQLLFFRLYSCHMTIETQPLMDCLHSRWGGYLKNWTTFTATTVAWSDQEEALLGPYPWFWEPYDHESITINNFLIQIGLGNVNQTLKSFTLGLDTPPPSRSNLGL